MPRQIILLSGPIASGKTQLAQTLVSRYGFILLKTRDLIARAGADTERGSLQAVGEQLDRRTNGRWVADALASADSEQKADVTFLVDAVRIQKQIDAVRTSFGRPVMHIHLTASERTLAARYKERKGTIKELPSFRRATQDPTEGQVETLRNTADIVIDTDRASKADVLVRVAARLGLYGRAYAPLVDVLVGGQFGSEGKGHIASYLGPEYDYLVRVGGPNAGHTVFTEPTPTVFHHLPSATVSAPNAKLILGPGSVIRLARLLREILDHGIDKDRIYIDPQAMIIEDADATVEMASIRRRIASTGQGVGVATARKVLRGAVDLGTGPVRLAKDIKELRPYRCPTLEVLERAFSEGRRVLLEGTQGSGLSLHHGQYPYVTSRDTTVAGCLAEAGIAPSRVRKILMVLRTYPIRVGGRSGPLVGELEWGDVHRRSGVPLPELEETELTSTTKRKRRVGEFNWELLRKAASLNGPTDLAWSFADYLNVENRRARRFEQLTEESINFIQEVEAVVSAPVSLIATRFDVPSRSIIDRRRW